TYVGDEVAGSHQVTIRMLLSHTSGYNNVYADPAILPLFPPGFLGSPVGTGPLEYHPDQPYTFAELNAGIHTPKNPGTAYQYQNPNLIVLLRVLVQRFGGDAEVATRIRHFLARAGSVRPEDGRQITQDRYADNTVRHFAHGYQPLANNLGL